MSSMPLTQPPDLEIPGDVVVFPLSFAQQRLWFLHRLTPDTAAYHIPLAVRLRGPLDACVLEQAIRGVQQRHESLRTTFGIVDDQPMQLVAPHASFRLDVIALDALPAAERETAARAYVTEGVSKPFDLELGPVLRGSLLKLDETDHVLTLVFHHIAADGWSLGIFFRELAALYEVFRSGLPSPLPELAIQYGDFAVWQREWLTGSVLEKQLSHWRKQLAGLPVVALPTDRPRPPMQTFRGAGRVVPIPRALGNALQRLSQAAGATLAMTMQAVFAALLQRYTGQDDITVGTPIANRNRSEIEGLIGFFVNSLAIRTDLSGDPTFLELLARVRDVALEAYAHQDLPFEKLVEDLQPERDPSRNPLFQVWCAVQNAPMGALKLAGISVEPFAVDIAPTRFDLELHLWEAEGNYTAVFLYNPDLLNAATIERIANHFSRLVQEVVIDPERRLSTLPLLSDRERKQILVDWNATTVDYASDAPLHELVEQQVRRSPTSVAIQFGDRSLTYKELNSRADQLAHWLRARGVGRNKPVAICVERSVEMVVGLLGILKAGGAYLPLEPEHPRRRLAAMLESSGAQVVLTQASLRTAIPISNRGSLTVAALDADWPSIAAAEPIAPTARVAPGDAAYIIFTSGSTGQPKGVVNTHEGVCNRLLWMQQQYGLAPSDCVLQKTPFGFDVSVWEFFWPLMVGATLVVAEPGGHQDPRYLARTIRDARITTMHFVPSMLRAFLDTHGAHECASLTRVFCSGEALPADLPARFFRQLSAELHNLYGPTEAAIDVSFYRCDPKAIPSTIPIGRPVANTQLYVLDSSLQPVPIGVLGELYIGGIQVARGYLNQPQLTAERFVPDPFSRRTGAQLYRTGDRARWLPTGNLEFHGRIDHQVKIRGNRIECGEIEATLTEHPAVSQAVVIAREDTPGDLQLVAYVVPDQATLAALTGTDTLAAEQVAEWQGVYDETYSSARVDDPTFDITGWNSSYTDDTIPAHEMREWVNGICDRVRSGAPQDVLEIGCGTGLLLFQIAPGSRSYTGSDFSATVIESLRGRVAQHVPLGNVTLLRRTADDFAGVEGRRFDSVVLNSVVQYFPSVEYLARVLDGAVPLVRDGGRIVIGDVRSLVLLEAFHTSVELYRSEAGVTTEQLRARAVERLGRERELVLDPAFFRAWGARSGRVSAVEILPKRSTASNELSKFRYDVILHVGAAAAAPEPPTWLDWSRDRLSIAELQRRLLRDQPAALGVLGVPNARVAADVRLTEMLRGGDAPATVGELREQFTEPCASAVDPAQWWSAFSGLPYVVDVRWTRADDQVDVQFRRRTDAAPTVASFPEPPLGDQAFSAYANNPLQAKVTRDLTPALRAHLGDRVPDYMVPGAFIVLEDFPLTVSGKVDRRALPSPLGARSEVQVYVAPRNATEEAVAGIWQTVLGMRRIGVKDNFFELGGHSLLATQVVSRIRDSLQIDIALGKFFAQPTIEALSLAALQQLADDSDADDLTRLLAEVERPGA